MTVSSPGAPRWRHISQSGSNTEVFDYRCRELSKLTKEVTPMDRQFDPVQMESNQPITQGLQHIPTEPPTWAETAGRVIHYLMNDFGGGRRWLKLAWVINFQKLATIPLFGVFIAWYHNTSAAAWISVGPACDPAVFGANHGSPVQRDWNLPPAAAWGVSRDPSA